MPNSQTQNLRMQTILVFIGTRPEAIKLAPVIAELRTRHNIKILVCLSSQHKEMLQQALIWFPIDIDEDLAIIRDGEGLTGTFAAILTGMEKVIERVKPDWIIVQGDTTTALAGALAGSYANVKVAHVEAGLRSGNRNAPFPEEINRMLISRLALLHFAPTQKNADILRAEKTQGAIHVVGNTVIDALLHMQKMIIKDAVKNTIKKSLAMIGYEHSQQDYILVTGHRRESFGTGLENICRALLQIATAYPHIRIMYAAHLNPCVYDTVSTMLSERNNIVILPPLNYAEFVYLMENCQFIMTDSGGIQEESPSLDKPVLVMRNDTERPEVLQCGAAKLTGTDEKDIVAAATELLQNAETYQRMAAAPNPYGDGKSAQRIADILIQS